MFWNKRNLSMRSIYRASESEALIKEKAKEQRTTVKVTDMNWKEITIQRDYERQLKNLASWEWHMQKYRQDILEKFLSLTNS